MPYSFLTFEKVKLEVVDRIRRKLLRYFRKNFRLGSLAITLLLFSRGVEGFSREIKNAQLKLSQNLLKGLYIPQNKVYEATL